EAGGDAAFLHGHASMLVTVMAEIAARHHDVARPHLGAKFRLQLGEAHRLELRDIERVEVGHLRILDDAVVGADVVAELPDAPADLRHAGLRAVSDSPPGACSVRKTGIHFSGTCGSSGRGSAIFPVTAEAATTYGLARNERALRLPLRP